MVKGSAGPFCIAARYPDRIVHVVGDAAYVGERLRDMDARITWTSRLKVTSVLHELPPPGTAGRARYVRAARLRCPQGQLAFHDGDRAAASPVSPVSRNRTAFFHVHSGRLGWSSGASSSSRRWPLLAAWSSTA